MDAEANLKAYLDARSATDRYASFDYCFNYFRSFQERGRVAELAEGRQLETSCLQLGFYLASWGMYRGSTVLLEHSVAYLSPVVQAIVESPAQVWLCDADNYSPFVCSLILDTGRHINSALDNRATETLVTKVMLGVFGCVPAFDTNFTRGSGWWKSSRSALDRIAEFYWANARVIEDNRVRTLDFATGEGTAWRYSCAKVIDMIFFQEGLQLGRPKVP